MSRTDHLDSWLASRLYLLQERLDTMEKRIEVLEKKSKPDCIPDIKFKMGQVVINTINSASFTIRQMRWHVDQWQYSNSKPYMNYTPTWVCETKLRELNDTEKGL